MTSPASSPKPDDIEEGVVLRPKFDAAGLLTCVTTDAATGEVLMVAHMNAEALQKTVESGTAWYFSRSRNRLWQKGESSGHLQRVQDIRIDCDQDAIWLRVDQQGGAACHTGRRSCFYRTVIAGDAGVELKIVDDTKLFDPAAVYGKAHKHD